jgi:circadian clock protein KaiC
VYPRLGAYTQPEIREHRTFVSGVDGLDRLLGGGLESGTSCLIVGASGTGKSSIATSLAASATATGARCALFLFDERPETFIARSAKVGIEVRGHIDSGRMLVKQLDPGEISPGEFAQEVRTLVEDEHIKVVIVDSVIGYFAAMGSADVLLTQLHELLTYLTRNDVLFILCGAQEGFMSIGVQQAVDVSYLSDTIIALTYFESEGALRRAVAVVKKKHGAHANEIHEIVLAQRSLRVEEEPLTQQRNIMVVPRHSAGGSGGDGEGR